MSKTVIACCLLIAGLTTIGCDAQQTARSDAGEQTVVEKASSLDPGDTEPVSALAIPQSNSNDESTDESAEAQNHGKGGSEQNTGEADQVAASETPEDGDSTNKEPEAGQEPRDPADNPKEVAEPVSKFSPDGFLKLNKQGTVLLDKEGRRVLLKTKVCMREGVLEMLVCQEQTKEHESILKIDAKSYVVHAGLLALGIKPGRPVEFGPFVPPKGQVLDIYATWTDKADKVHRQKAQDWVRYSIYRYYDFPMKQLPDGFKLPANDDLRFDDLNGMLLWFGPMAEEKRDKLMKLSDDENYKKAIREFYRQGVERPMKAKFVFAGSFFYDDEETGKRRYAGEGGHLICVANFPAATIDVAIESSAVNETQMFEAWTDRIPPKGTEVTIELIPAEKSTADAPSAVKPDPAADQETEQQEPPAAKKSEGTQGQG